MANGDVQRVVSAFFVRGIFVFSFYFVRLTPHNHSTEIMQTELDDIQIDWIIQNSPGTPDTDGDVPTYVC